MGTSAYFASSVISLWAKTRAKIKSLKRLKTLAVSLIDSFTPNWMSEGPKNNACPPSMDMPVSVETRVRVDLFWKIILSECPSKGFGSGLDLSEKMDLYS